MMSCDDDKISQLSADQVKRCSSADGRTKCNYKCGAQNDEPSSDQRPTTRYPMYKVTDVCGLFRGHGKDEREADLVVDSFLLGCRVLISNNNAPIAARPSPAHGPRTDGDRPDISRGQVLIRTCQRHVIVDSLTTASGPA